VVAFQSVVSQGAEYAASGCLVTFGVTPTSPKTEYGYIHKGESLHGAISDDMRKIENEGKQAASKIPSFRVSAFVEKPKKEAATRIFETGEYLWNSGIFMMRVSVWLDQLTRHRSDIAAVCIEAYKQGHKDGDFYRPDAKIFAACPSDSIDYAVMEKIGLESQHRGATPLFAESDAATHGAPDCVVVTLEAGWSDLGAWSTLWEEGNKDPQGNVIQGEVYPYAIRNSLIIAQHRLVAAIGLDDIVIVETADAVLAAHKDYVQEVKSLVARLKAEGRAKQENHCKVHRPWGFYEIVDMEPCLQVRRLTVNPGAALSLQTHLHRAEHWVVVKGTAKVTKGDEEFLLTENQSTYAPIGVKHRLENPGTIPLEIIEVQSGSYLAEDDILRYEDRNDR
jgi:mannose-1-phosphate guanylyltransferase/mannose-6-phosphate isomerase-like protein (cupin superfamily)